MIAWDAKERPEKEAGNKYDSDDYLGNSSNSGTMIVHATCAPSNIRYLQDVSLLNETRANVEEFFDFLHDSADGKKPQARPQGLPEIHKMPRAYRKSNPQSYWKAVVLPLA